MKLSTRTIEKIETMLGQGLVLELRNTPHGKIAVVPKPSMSGEIEISPTLISEDTEMTLELRILSPNTSIATFVIPAGFWITAIKGGTNV